MLSISARTVRFHIDNSKQKLGVETRMQAITKSLREKLFEI
jgi:DNA-binding CsgD family transcriptional regulator